MKNWEHLNFQKEDNTWQQDPFPSFPQMLVHWSLVCWIACFTWPKNEFPRGLVHSERAISSFRTEVNLKRTSGRALSRPFWPGCLSVGESSWLQCFSTASLNAVGPDSGTQAQHEWKAGWRGSDVPPPPQHRPGKLGGVRGAATAVRGAFSR